MASPLYYVTAIDYQVKHMRPVVQVFARDEQGNRHRFQDGKFLPRLYVPHNERQDLEPYPVPALDGTVMAQVFKRYPKDVATEKKKYSRTGQADILFPVVWAIEKEIKAWFELADDGKIIPRNDIDRQAPIKGCYCDIECEIGDRFYGPNDPQSMVLSCVLGFMWSNQDISQTKFYVFKAANEEEEAKLLIDVANVIAMEDPDVLTSYNNFDFPYMNERAKKKGIGMSNMSPLGWVRTSLNERMTIARWDTHIAGRNYIDLWEAYNRFFQGKNFDSEKLDDRVNEDCGFKPDGFDYNTMKRENLEAVVQHNIHHVKALITLERFHQLIPYLMIFRDLAGCPLKYTSKASKMFDVLMLRYYKGKYILPTTSYASIEGEDYQGAFVKEPPDEGIFGPWIPIFDFSQMYPTLIQRKNMCPTTLIGKLPVDRVDHKTMHAVDVDGKGQTFICFKREPEGILPQVINELGAMRKKAKKEMDSIDDTKSPEYKRSWNKQYGMKQTINAGAYGLNAYTKFRLYAPLIAEATTAAGREAIGSTIDEIKRKFDHDALAGDTDSCFELDRISVTKEDAVSHGKKIEAYINQWWADEAVRSGSKYSMKIAFEKLARRVIYLKKRHGDAAAKKRYGLLIVWQDGKWQEKVSLTGVEAKRRDAAMVSRKLQKDIINVGLYGETSQIVPLLHKVQMTFKTLPLDEIGIPVSLSKDLDQFENAESTKKSLVVSREVLEQEWNAGDKGFKFYMAKNFAVPVVKGKKKKVIKSTAIVIKRDLNGKLSIPDGFVIDYQTQYEKVVINKLEKLLSACGVSRAVLEIGWNQNGKVHKQMMLGEQE